MSGATRASHWWEGFTSGTTRASRWWEGFVSGATKASHWWEGLMSGDARRSRPIEARFRRAGAFQLFSKAISRCNLPRGARREVSAARKAPREKSEVIFLEPRALVRWRKRFPTRMRASGFFRSVSALEKRSAFSADALRGAATARRIRQERFFARIRGEFSAGRPVRHQTSTRQPQRRSLAFALAHDDIVRTGSGEGDQGSWLRRAGSGAGAAAMIPDDPIRRLGSRGLLFFRRPLPNAKGHP